MKRKVSATLTLIALCLLMGFAWDVSSSESFAKAVETMEARLPELFDFLETEDEITVDATDEVVISAASYSTSTANFKNLPKSNEAETTRANQLAFDQVENDNKEYLAAVIAKETIAEEVLKIEVDEDEEVEDKKVEEKVIVSADGEIITDDGTTDTGTGTVDDREVVDIGEVSFDNTETDAGSTGTTVTDAGSTGTTGTDAGSTGTTGTDTGSTGTTVTDAGSTGTTGTDTVTVNIA